jgi:hypothetical protein
MNIQSEEEAVGRESSGAAFNSSQQLQRRSSDVSSVSTPSRMGNGHHAPNGSHNGSVTGSGSVNGSGAAGKQRFVSRTGKQQQKQPLSDSEEQAEEEDEEQEASEDER